jgi:hypothetical protein
MKQSFRVLVPLVLAAAIGPIPALATADPGAKAPEFAVAGARDWSSPLAETIREATRPFRDLGVAEAAGYGMLHGCVSGPDGAMGVHYANGDLVGDPALDATRPEVLMYEWRNGSPRLVGVEFVVLADSWHAEHPAPPVLAGQLFAYTGAPNRYGIPAFYSLHVWAWRPNPDGVFADWNPRVSCAEYVGTPEETASAH